MDGCSLNHRLPLTDETGSCWGGNRVKRSPILGHMSIKGGGLCAVFVFVFVFLQLG